MLKQKNKKAFCKEEILAGNIKLLFEGRGETYFIDVFPKSDDIERWRFAHDRRLVAKELLSCIAEQGVNSPIVELFQNAMTAIEADDLYVALDSLSACLAVIFYSKEEDRSGLHSVYLNLKDDICNRINRLEKTIKEDEFPKAFKKDKYLDHVRLMIESLDGLDV